MSVYQRESGPPAFVVPPSVRGLAAGCRYSSWQRRLHLNRTHAHVHVMAHRNPEGAILDGFVKVRESVETVYTKNFNGFYFKHLQRKSHQIVTTNIKSVIVTNPRLDCQFICVAYFLTRTSTDAVLWLKC